MTIFDAKTARFPQRVAVLVSGRGSNLQALLKNVNPARATFCGVISSDPDQPAVTIATAAGVPTAVAPKNFHEKTIEERDAWVIAQLTEWKTDWVCLAGFRRVIGAKLLKAFEDRVLNIHPSLLPAFPGMHAQKQAWEHGVRVTGATVHFVDTGVDSGPIVLQASVTVDPAESVDQLSQRILKVEHELYSRSLNTLLERGCRVTGRRVEFLS